MGKMYYWKVVSGLGDNIQMVAKVGTKKEAVTIIKEMADLKLKEINESNKYSNINVACYCFESARNPQCSITGSIDNSDTVLLYRFYATTRKLL